MFKNKKNKNNDENQKMNKKDNINNEVILGNFEDIPKYFQHNEYIRKGYRLNCNTILKASKSLFMIHNESVNIWSHLLGAILFIFLICYTSIFISNFKSQIKNIKNYLYEIEKEYTKLPKIIEDNMINSLVKSFNIFKYNFINLKSDINYIYKQSFITLNDTYTKIMSKIDTISNNFHNFFYSFNIKFIELREKFLDLLELENISLGRNKDIYLNITRSPKKLRRWPIFIFLISAIFCLSSSSIFHLIGNISPPFHRILSRFDYGGVCLLITGSCYPPIYYYFYYESKYRTFYLSFITIFGLTIFGLCLTNGFNLPDKRVFRGSLFLTFGICTGIPFLHIILFGDSLKGYNNNARFCFWFLGGIIYIIGAVLYLIRFPEKLYPGKFDIFGSSHQLLHISVLIAVYCHYIGSLDAYFSRFDLLY